MASLSLGRLSLQAFRVNPVRSTGRLPCAQVSSFRSCRSYAHVAAGSATKPTTATESYTRESPLTLKPSSSPTTEWQSYQPYHGDHIRLRDSCQCAQCVDQSTSQREFNYADIPTDIQAEVRPAEGQAGLWQVRWKNDIAGFQDHESVFPSQLLAHPGTKSQTKSYDHFPAVLWDKDSFATDSSPVSCRDFMETDAGLARVLTLFARHGLVMISDIPTDPDSVRLMAERLGPLRNTFYGDTWNVRSVPQAKNVAYTSKYLGFHMDLLYMRESPTVQLLHCVENSSQGGESRYVDTFKAIDVLCTEDPEAVEILSQTAIKYEYDNDGQYFTNTKLVLDLPNDATQARRRCLNAANQRARYAGKVFWSPPFVGVFSPEESTTADPNQRGSGGSSNNDNISRYSIVDQIRATQKFAAILERPELVYEAKMEAGTCAIFHNLRVLHARNAFDMNSGNRWLRGAYVDGQDIESRTIGLADRVTALYEEFGANHD